MSLELQLISFALYRRFSTSVFHHLWDLEKTVSNLLQTPDSIILSPFQTKQLHCNLFHILASMLDFTWGTHLAKIIWKSFAFYEHQWTYFQKKNALWIKRITVSIIYHFAVLYKVNLNCYWPLKNNKYQLNNL